MASKNESKPRPIAIDLFCGAGGMSLGFERAGFDIALGVDRDGYHVATHERNFPHGKSLCRSVADLTAEDIFAALDGEREIDAIFGGPPCQGFSNMGHRDALDPRNTLVNEFVRIVSEVRPKAFCMENVPGMLAGATRPVLDDALKKFARAGYRIAQPLRVLDASHFGVPQKRKRLIVVGIRNDIGGEFVFPSVAPDGYPALPTVWEAIADLPNVDDREQLYASNDTSYDTEPSSDYAKMLRSATVGKCDFSHKRSWDVSRCTGCLRVDHSAKSIALYSATQPGAMVPGHKLPRLDPHGIAPTLRAGSDSSHGSYTAPRPIHPYRPRCITVREAARLHGFPDWFTFYPLKWHGYRQIGNSVCPPVAHALGLAILRAIGVRPSKPRGKVVLADEFQLPPDRPRTLKRIPQVVHYPPVIDWLFRRRTKADSTFDFGDVQKAIAETGVSLTWVRSDTFLQEIARSRNVAKLLEPCLSQGFTIRRIEHGNAIGEFVRIGHAEGIEVKAPPKLPSAKGLRKKG